VLVEVWVEGEEAPDPDSRSVIVANGRGRLMKLGSARLGKEKGARMLRWMGEEAG
jgi:hypothetical protein